jgi:hypothetical protein
MPNPQEGGRNITLGEEIIMNDIDRPIEWQDGESDTVEIGYLNRHGQQCCGHCGVPGTDHSQYAYKTECTICGYVYGANGSDMHERRCPECQGGAPGIRYWQVTKS